MSKINHTCFEEHKIKNKSCQVNSCRYWHDLLGSQNCILNKVNKQEDLTLQEVGELFNITRMRVCQIEKVALESLRHKKLF
tara:strand:- start:70 stop:312 length:243 start_codon:yes stop_codon:yes gene_type:complete